MWDQNSLIDLSDMLLLVFGKQKTLINYARYSIHTVHQVYQFETLALIYDSKMNLAFLV
jgi:hypothetical protein